jgi:tRNA A37 threonylcarbamoyladenosine synthetase subunit TsaC/SUA5/YrdC
MVGHDFTSEIKRRICSDAWPANYTLLLPIERSSDFWLNTPDRDRP